MMALDDLTGDVERLDAVGIDSALCQPTGIGNLASLSIEHLHKVATDDLTFLFGITDTSKVCKELRAGIDADNIEAQHFVVFHHLRELVLTKHSVIDEDAGKILANGLIQQDCSDRRIDTTRESEDDTVVADLFLDFLDSCLYERGGAPVLLGATDIHHKILQQGLALQGVINFRVELNGPDILLIPEGGVLDILCTTDDLKTIGNGGDGVSMTHPYL